MKCHSRAASEGDATGYYASRDQFEQQIIRAYVRLALSDDADCSRTATLSRLGGLEVRLTEAPWIEQPDLPPFWLELHTLTTGTTIDSIGCFDFGENELEAAVDFVCEAKAATRPETEDIHGALSGLDDGAVEPLARMRQGRET